MKLYCWNWGTSWENVFKINNVIYYKIVASDPTLNYIICQNKYYLKQNAGTHFLFSEYEENKYTHQSNILNNKSKRKWDKFILLATSLELEPYSFVNMAHLEPQNFLTLYSLKFPNCCKKLCSIPQLFWCI